jgi:hypothetical protein
MKKYFDVNNEDWGNDVHHPHYHSLYVNWLAFLRASTKQFKFHYNTSCSCNHQDIINIFQWNLIMRWERKVSKYQQVFRLTHNLHLLLTFSSRAQIVHVKSIGWGAHKFSPPSFSIFSSFAESIKLIKFCTQYLQTNTLCTHMEIIECSEFSRRNFPGRRLQRKTLNGWRNLYLYYYYFSSLRLSRRLFVAKKGMEIKLRLVYINAGWKWKNVGKHFVSWRIISPANK